jgi:hypothetical protein
VAYIGDCAKNRIAAILLIVGKMNTISVVNTYFVLNMYGHKIPNEEQNPLFQDIIFHPPFIDHVDTPLSDVWLSQFICCQVYTIESIDDCVRH